MRFKSDVGSCPPPFKCVVKRTPHYGAGRNKMRKKVSFLFLLFIITFLYAVEPLKNVDECESKDIPSMWPIRGKSKHVSMLFGPYTDPDTQEIKIHKGIDLSTWRAGDPVYVTADGYVITIDYNETYGNYIIVQHKKNISTLYARLSEVKVKQDDIVKQGDIIGLIGDTGEGKGVCLHYEIHVGLDVVDPLPYLDVTQ